MFATVMRTKSPNIIKTYLYRQFYQIPNIHVVLAQSTCRFMIQPLNLGKILQHISHFMLTRSPKTHYNQNILLGILSDTKTDLLNQIIHLKSFLHADSSLQ